MKITDLPAAYARNHDIRSSTREQLDNVAKLLHRFIGAAATSYDLSADMLNRWLDARKRVVANRTVRGNRTSAMMLWREAHRIGASAIKPEGVKTIKKADIVPVALLRHEIVKLLAEAAKLEDTFERTGQSRALWMESLLRAIYDTGMRRDDCWSLEIPWITTGRVTIVQHKTGHRHTAQLRTRTMELIAQLVGDRKTGLIWLPWWSEDDSFNSLLTRMRKRAGLPYGNTKHLRRASASYVEAEHPGCGAKHLGHRTAGMAEEFYLDPRIVKPQTFLPTDIDDAA